MFSRLVRRLTCGGKPADSTPLLSSARPIPSVCRRTHDVSEHFGDEPIHVDVASRTIRRHPRVEIRAADENLATDPIAGDGMAHVGQMHPELPVLSPL